MPRTTAQFRPRFEPLAEQRGHGKHYVAIDKNRRLMFLKRAQDEFGLTTGAIFQASLDRDETTGDIYLGIRKLGATIATSATDRKIDSRNYSLAIAIHDKLQAYGVTRWPARFNRDNGVDAFDDAGESITYFRLIR